MHSTAAVEAHNHNLVIAVREWGYDHGGPSGTLNEQLGQNRPNLHPDPRGFDDHKLEEHEDRGATVPGLVFNSGQFCEDAEHTGRYVKCWGECQCLGEIID